MQCSRNQGYSGPARSTIARRLPPAGTGEPRLGPTSPSVWWDLGAWRGQLWIAPRVSTTLRGVGSSKVSVPGRDIHPSIETCRGQNGHRASLCPARCPAGHQSYKKRPRCHSRPHSHTLSHLPLPSQHLQSSPFSYSTTSPSLNSITMVKVLVVLYSGGDAAREQPRLLGTIENQLGISGWLKEQGHE